MRPAHLPDGCLIEAESVRVEIELEPNNERRFPRFAIMKIECFKKLLS